MNPDDADILAAEAADGAVVGDWKRGSRRVNRVNISFWRSEADAEKTTNEYEAFAESQGNSQEGRLFQHGQVVVAFKQTPSQRERSTVERCLRA